MSAGDVADPRLSFDDILEAVQDSKRGRWFLEEYRARLQREESSRILKAISKLETRMEALPQSAGTDAELEKVRSAIAATRRDIAGMGLLPDAQQNDGNGLSEEGRLFASLAELARKALPQGGNAAVVPGVVRALHLVDKLDTALNGTRAGTVAATPGKMADSYFAQDADLFEAKPRAATAASIMTVVDTPKPKAETAAPQVATALAPTPTKADVVVPKQAEAASVPTGARFVIVKAGSESAPEAIPEPISETVPAAEPVAETVAAVAAPAAMELEKPKPAEAPVLPASHAPLAQGEPQDLRSDTPRIVIIRRKPEDMAELPLAAEATIAVPAAEAKGGEPTAA